MDFYPTILFFPSNKYVFFHAHRYFCLYQAQVLQFLFILFFVLILLGYGMTQEFSWEKQFKNCVLKWSYFFSVIIMNWKVELWCMRREKSRERRANERECAYIWMHDLVVMQGVSSCFIHNFSLIFRMCYYHLFCPITFCKSTCI